MNAPAVLGAGLKLWAQDWIRWGAVTLLFTGVVSIVIAAIDPWMATYGGYGMAPAIRAHDPNVWAILLTLVQVLLLAPWLALILAKGTLQGTFEEGRRPLVGRTISGVPSMLWIGLLLVLGFIVAVIPIAIVSAFLAAVTPRDAEAGGVFFVAVIGFLALFLWIVPRLWVLVQVFVGEDVRGTRAIRETWRRSEGAWTAALGVVVLTVLIGLGISLVPAVIATAAFPLSTAEHAVARAILYALTNALTTPIGVAIQAALYLELSARDGVLDQATLRQHLSRFDRR